MKDLEQLEKEVSEIVITISKKDFIDKASEICAKNATLFPMAALVVVPVIGELTTALFHNENDKAEEVKKD